MRGKKIYNELKPPKPPVPIRKGRSESLLEQRNECLMTRYFYYCFIKEVSYDDLLRLLVSEFFISAHTIVEYIRKHTDKLAAMRSHPPSVYSLQAKWPHLRW